jgi:O-antigen ligase
LPIPQPTNRAALVVLQVAAVVIVLAAFPYQLFHLDRYTFAKELVLLAAGLGATLCCLASARRLTVFAVDALLGAFLAVSALGAVFATNRWLSFRALAVSLAAAAVFWCARTLARAGLARPLLVTLAAAVVLGAGTGLVQAYGLVETSLTSLTRAPGGTFGNRNFMAHLVAVGLPLLLLVSVEARSRRGFGLGAIGFSLAAGALVLSRSRAAWLGAAASGLFLAVEGLWVGRLWADPTLRRRVLRLAGIAVASLALAVLLPNRLNWRSDSPYLESLAGVANYREGSGAGRLIQYGNTLRMAADHPVLGVGAGNWPVHYPRYMSPGDPSFDADDIIPTNPWPSSDWMGMLAERGVPGLLLLALVGASIALGAWARVRRGSRHTPALTDLTIVATLIAVAVVGSFDAVLLLPVPTFFAWTIIGALASTARPVREITLTHLSRRRLLLAVGLVGGLLVLRAAGQTAAMAVFSNAASRAGQEAAARLDPGSYRIRMLLAQAWRRAGSCARARPHAEAAAGLFPHYPAPARLLRACGPRRAR